ncbi:MAG: RNA polymerase sigma factor (sigma-70 family) [Cognaticolwellia sp.]|jgi:RNA polymerase sigma factor (sigma-70 family)
MNSMERALASRGRIWALGFRMLGAPQDADDLVQDTFVRLAERPPTDIERPLEPWLLTVAANLARDRLRARKLARAKRPYVPAPLPPSRHDAASSLAMRQSASVGWLLAAEALTPEQRLVWLLREVMECSTAEVAELTESSPGAVRACLFRARKGLAEHPIPKVDAASAQAHTLALLSFTQAMLQGDLEAARAWLAPDAVYLADGGEQYRAAGLPIRGAERLLRVFAALQTSLGEVRAVPAWAAGMPGLWIQVLEPKVGHAPASLVQVVLDDQGRIAAVTTLMDPARLDPWYARVP